MKATIAKLCRDAKIAIWGEAHDKRGKVYIEVDKSSADYAIREYSNVKKMRTACEYAPEIRKWWITLA